MEKRFSNTMIFWLVLLGLAMVGAFVFIAMALLEAVK